MSNLIDDPIIPLFDDTNTMSNLPNISLPSGVSQQIGINNLKGDLNVNLPTQANSPDSISSPGWSQNTVPMVTLNDSSANYGRKVMYIDPKLASDKLREMSTNSSIGLLSPSYSYSPGRVRPPLGTVLQTPPDLTPTRIPGSYVSNLGYGYLGPAQSPAIAKSISDFLQALPSAATTQISVPPTTSPAFNNNTKYNTFNSTPRDPRLSPSSFSPQSQPMTQSQPMPQQVPVHDHNARVQDAKKKADYRVKFSILREAYPQMNIPEPGEDESIDEIEAAYKEYVKRIHVESSVEQNKVYLLILWLIIDVVGTRCFRLPFNGRYFRSQYKHMQKYTMLLIELGERSYVDGAMEGWPVEFRLLAMALFHGVIMALVYMLASKVGSANAANDKMADQIQDAIDNILTQNKGADVLRRAEQANVDNPVPASASESASPPGGDWGAMLGNFMPMIMGMFGGNESQDQQAAPQPQIKKPTTFGARHRKTQTNT